MDTAPKKLNGGEPLNTEESVTAMRKRLKKPSLLTDRATEDVREKVENTCEGMTENNSIISGLNEAMNQCNKILDLNPIAKNLESAIRIHTNFLNNNGSDAENHNPKNHYDKLFKLVIDSIDLLGRGNPTSNKNDIITTLYLVINDINSIDNG